MAKRISGIRWAICILVGLFSLLLPIAGHANVTITPVTVLISDHDRFADVTLINSGNEPNTYEMGWQFFRQEDGTGEYITIPGSLTAFDLSKHIVFTPKRITIPAGGMQRVRMALRLNGETPAPGDYRGHFIFRETDTPAADGAPSTKPKVGIHIKVGFSIPIVYRAGTSDATAHIGSVATGIDAKSGKILITVPVARTGGPYGILGDLQLFYQAAGSPEIKIGEITNANIFPESSHVNFKVLSDTDDLKKGKLRILYRDRDLKKDVVFDQKIIPIQ